jgi:heme exporter protein A
MDDKPLIIGEQLTCIRKDHILFEALDIRVYPKEILYVQGENGSGKTSLLRILAGLSKPLEGQVCYHDSRHLTTPKLLYIGHESALKNDLNLLDNLELFHQIQDEPLFNPQQALKNMALEGYEETLAAELSAGQKKRAALARLAHSKARVWILDEPFTSIDHSGIKFLKQTFLNHVQNGGCLIVTTHQPLFMTNYAKIRTLEL